MAETAVLWLADRKGEPSELSWLGNRDELAMVDGSSMGAGLLSISRAFSAMKAQRVVIVVNDARSYLDHPKVQLAALMSKSKSILLTDDTNRKQEITWFSFLFKGVPLLLLAFCLSHLLALTYRLRLATGDKEPTIIFPSDPPPPPTAFGLVNIKARELAARRLKRKGSNEAAWLAWASLMPYQPLSVKATTLFRDWENAALERGRSQRSDGKLNGALSTYRILVNAGARPSGLAEQLEDLHYAFWEQRSFEEALECADHLVWINEKYVSFKVDLAEKLVEHHQYALAEKVTHQLVDERPSSQPLERLMAQTLLKQHKYEEAYEHLKNYCCAYPDDSEMCDEIIFLLNNKPDLSDLEKAQKILQYRPSDEKAHETLMTMHLERRELKEGLHHLAAAGNKEPEKDGVRLRGVTMLWQKDCRHEADSLVREVEETLRQSPRGMIALARLYVAIERTERARALLEKAAEALPEDGSAALELAEMLYWQGRCDEAVKWLAVSRSINPEEPNAIRLAERLEFAGEGLLPEAAIEELGERLREKGPYGTYEPKENSILAIVHSLCCGGAESFMARAVNRLASRDLGLYDVTLLVRTVTPQSSRGFHLPSVEEAGVSVYCQESFSPQIDTHRKLSELVELVKRGFPKDLAETFLWFLAMIRKERPQIVWALDHIGAIAGLAAASLGVPTIVLRSENMNPSRLTDIYTERTVESHRHLSTAYKTLATLDNVVLANVCEAGARDYENWLDLPKGKFNVLANGLDPRHFEEPSTSPKALRKQFEIPDGAPVVGSVFRLTAQKCPILWVEAAASVSKEIPETHFIHIGGGELEGQVQTRARELGLTSKLHLIGRQDDLAPWYRVMDVFLLASSVEGLPHVLLEAQAAGVPVVCPDVGGCKEAFIPEETGFLTDERKAESFAKKVTWILQNPQWCENAATVARERTRELFTMDAALTRFLAFSNLNVTPSLEELPLSMDPAINEGDSLPIYKGLKLNADFVHQFNRLRGIPEDGPFCLAPWASLYFSLNGDVLPCCMTRFSPLGRYPDKTIDEIWRSKEMSDFRNALARYELPDGCWQCAQRMLKHDYESVQARFFDCYYHDGIVNSFPLLPSESDNPVAMEFELSNKCNLACIMCSAYLSSECKDSRRGTAVTSPYDEAFIEQVTPYLKFLKMAKFYGGEPFVIPLYRKLWRTLKEHESNTRIVITTNCTVLPKETMRLLETFDLSIVASIDSLEKETYEFIRQGAHFERMMENLDYLLKRFKEGKIHLNLTVCPMRCNWRQIPRLVEFAIEHGTGLYFNDVIFPPEQSLIDYDGLPDVLEFYNGQRKRFKVMTLSDSEPITVFEGLISQLESLRTAKEKNG